jgi:S1-C subfamily serine protease
MSKVEVGSVAAGAGFRSGDVVTAVDGYQLRAEPGQVGGGG